MTGALQRMLDAIPYVRWHGLSVAQDDGGDVTARLPWRADLANLAGGWHAAALFCAAETAAGCAAWLVAADAGVMPLVRSAHVDYERRPEGDLAATATVDEGDARAARESVQARGRGDVRVSVTATDGTGSRVLAVGFEYVLRRMQREE